MELKHGTTTFASASTMLLLIVPYGIETYQVYPELQLVCQLLIVPYGIETLVSLCLNVNSVITFNRTLWN